MKRISNLLYFLIVLTTYNSSNASSLQLIKEEPPLFDLAATAYTLDPAIHTQEFHESLAHELNTYFH
jgi:hypothetical protein